MTFPILWLPYFTWECDHVADEQRKPGCISVFDGAPRNKRSRISDQCCRHGIPAYSMDIMNPKTQDVSTMLGVQHFLCMLARMAKGGLVWLAPPCSSFTQFMSRSVHQRSSFNPLGRMSDFVCSGNDLAEFCANAMLACNDTGHGI